MTDEGTTPKDEAQEWKPTKTTNKRAAANERKLAFLKDVYDRTRHGWRKVTMKDIQASHAISASLHFLHHQGVLEKRHKSEYRWRGGPPTLELANEWNELLRWYALKRLHPERAIPQKYMDIIDAMATMEQRILSTTQAMKSIYERLRAGNNNISLSELCIEHSVRYDIGIVLVEKGILRRPLEGWTYWNGPAPDEALAAQILQGVQRRDQQEYLKREERGTEPRPRGNIRAYITAEEPHEGGGGSETDVRSDEIAAHQPDLVPSDCESPAKPRPLDYWTMRSTSW